MRAFNENAKERNCNGEKEGMKTISFGRLGRRERRRKAHFFGTKAPETFFFDLHILGQGGCVNMKVVREVCEVSPRRGAQGP